MLNKTFTTHATMKMGAAVFTVLALSACGSSSNNDNDKHANTHIDTEGRLAIYDTDSQALKVIDLEGGDVLDSFTLNGAGTPSLYTLPGERYIAAIQRDDNLVSFLDSGLYTEDHGDHLHDYEEDPNMLSFTLTNVKPTHFESGEDSAIIFNDGSDESVSSVSVFSTSSIVDGDTLFELNRENNMHGAAKLIDDQLFVTYRDSSITDTTLPAEVERYSIDDGVPSFEARYDLQCPLLHGAGYNHETLIFGCSDGILAIDLQDENFTASKYSSPDEMAEGSRIGSVYTHHDVEALITRAGTQLFATMIEDSSVSYQELKLDEGSLPLSQNFTPNGEFFWVLADNEKVYLWAIDSGWDQATSVSISNLELGAVSVAQSTASHLMYVLDEDNQKIIPFDYEEGMLGETIDLDFAPSKIAWMGLPDHDHKGHDHEGSDEDSDEEHSHAE